MAKREVPRDDLYGRADRVTEEFMELVDSLQDDPEIAKEAMVTMEILLGGLKKANAAMDLAPGMARKFIRPALPKVNQFLQWAGKNTGKAFEFLAQVMENSK